MSQISILDPMARLAALGEAGSLAPFPVAGASPHVARWGITPVADDGVACARLGIGEVRVLAMAQDARFLGGSVGANHGVALQRLFQRALEEPTDVVVLLVDSGGVRLHEANAAELALARGLRALFGVRRAGIPTLAIVTGAAFGGASVLAAACEHLYFLPHARFGLSGPGVIEASHGKAELDARDLGAVASVFGATARVASGIGRLVDDDIGLVRNAIREAAHPTAHSLVQRGAQFNRAMLQEWDTRLAARLAASGAMPTPAPAAYSLSVMSILKDAKPVDPMGWLWRIRDSDVHVLRPLAPLAFDPAVAVSVARAITDYLPPLAPLVIVEDSPGHATTRAAEALGVSEYLAAHAGRLALLQMEGHVLLGLLAGCGHSAAFFVNALQAATLDALDGARVEAMATEAMARVTRLPASALAALIEDDPILGRPVRHLATLGGIARTHTAMSRAGLLARVAELR
jgi:malonate decarboxylase beta subunit